jgi:hypothetical protein
VIWFPQRSDGIGVTDSRENFRDRRPDDGRPVRLTEWFLHSTGWFVAHGCFRRQTEFANVVVPFFGGVFVAVWIVGIKQQEILAAIAGQSVFHHTERTPSLCSGSHNDLTELALRTVERTSVTGDLMMGVPSG